MTTKNTFLGDLKNKNIFIEIDINNINKIINNINKLIKKPSLLKKIAVRGIRYAKSNSWEKYRRNVIKEIY
jgi:riboflavin synthase